ncbi:hypothetical protein H310_07274 [Aphanomyces invadans]|uniref:UDENN domain-containing protein n=1 Tax=Aphanomyces invadans TaxID=157072 RepID=A0A024U388_9STRA|nr:hypothetical protein H310_07274 [Aphanomyces invadans]ETW00719.1 hypothetical protein H310_07274 [Aphanomyces invadans]|eukprot:XP_008870854.1 hypothetical protein H310_07274 [Aphanomyces invadans]
MAFLPTLVDYFVEVSIVDTEHTSVRAIRQRIPATDRDHFPLPDGVRYFCLPDKLNLRPRAAYERVPTFHSFTLTGGDGSRAFGFALTTYDHDDDHCGHASVAVPRVFCFISHFPIFSLFQQVLGWIYHHRDHVDDTAPCNLRRCILPMPRRSGNQEEVAAVSAAVPWASIIHDFVMTSVAPHGGSILDVHLGLDFVYTHTLHKSALPHVDDMCFQLLFQHLSVKNIVLILNCMMLEQRILIHSSHHGLLTPVCEALCALLYPFVWEHVYIPMLPMKLIDYLQAPVPFFMGVHTTYLTTKIGADSFASCVVIHLDKDKVVRPIHAALPDWTGQDLPHVEDHHLPKFPPAPLSTLVATVKTVLEEYAPPTNPHTAATNRIRQRRKARTSDALTIVRSSSVASCDLHCDTPPYVAPEVEISFGHGPLGITFESSRVWLLATGLADASSTPSCAASAVVKAFPQLQNGLPGPAALSGLIAPGSYLLSVNDHSTLHLSFEATCELLRHEPRPLVLRFQNATQMPYQNAMQFAARVRASSLVALPPNVPRPVQSVDHVEWVDAIRVAFASFFMVLFPDIAQYVTIQPALATTKKGQIARRHSVQRFVSFDREGFLRTRRSPSLAFFTAVVDTQAFVAFVNDTAVGQSPHLGLESPFVDLFHECVQVMDVPGAVQARLVRGAAVGPDKRVVLKCQGRRGKAPSPVATSSIHASPSSPTERTTASSPASFTSPSVMSKLFQDLELEIGEVDVADEPVIRVDTPQKRKSVTRQLERLICGAVIEVPREGDMHQGNGLGRRRRSLSDTSMLQLEEELLRPLDSDVVLAAVPVGKLHQQGTNSTTVAVARQPHDDGEIKRKIKRAPRPKFTSDKLWAAFRRKAKA